MTPPAGASGDRSGFEPSGNGPAPLPRTPAESPVAETAADETALAAGHLDPDALGELLEGILPDERAAAARAHLLGCPQCAALGADLDADLELLRHALRHLPPPGPMPVDIVHRIDVALADAGRYSGARTPRNEAPGVSPAATRAGITGSDPSLSGPAALSSVLDSGIPEAPPQSTTPASSSDQAAASLRALDPDGNRSLPAHPPRRRRSVRVQQVVAAVLVLGLSALAAPFVLDRSDVSGEGSSTRETAHEAPALGESAPSAPGGMVRRPGPASGGGAYPPGKRGPAIQNLVVTASGANYTDRTVPAAARWLATTAATDGSGESPSALARERSRLDAGTDEARLTACLAALSAGSATGPIAVDLARYAGKPVAVIVVPADRSSALDVYVVGPNCGVSGADLRRSWHLAR